ncbi:MAG TPA: Ig-like domain-containing protein, partial [Candidatus Cryosericum sp.]|nr:Ig-like domain-containing protein [Candidatus Cryosericum sp.]
WATAISAGPPDEAGQTLTFTVTSTTNPALFRVAPAVAPDGTLTFTPAPDANGSATITVILQDNGGTANGGIDTSVPQTFTISVTPVNDAPVVSAPPLVATLEDRPVSIFGITVTDVDINETPAPNNTVRVTLTVSHGTLSMSALTGLNFSVGHGTADRSMTFIGTLTNANMALGTLSYVPDQNYNNYIGAGLEVCLVTVSDMAHTGSGGNRVALKPICISVTPANDAPVALDATWTLTGDAVFSQVLQATDIDSAFLTYVIVSPPSHGLVTITGVSSGDFTYTPTPSYCGLDTFTFKVLDESLESNVATVVLAIHPAAVAVTFDTQGGSAVPPQTVAYGSCLVEPSVPTKAGMTFAGWYTDPADGTRWDVSAPVTTDLTLYAHWTVLTFTVTPSAGDHGMISPATVQTVPYGSTVTFTIAPDPGYQIADVQVDGVSVGAVASYMFQSVMADHTIHATFAPLGSLSLAAGWNLVAVPVPLPASSIPGLLGAYSYHDGWGVVTSADTLVPGEGYWVEVSAPVPVPLPGVSSPAALSLTYQAGWQLLGNPFDIPLPLASITNGNLITHCYSYSYGPGWGVLSPATDSLQPGRGYWIYLAAPTTLTLLHP